MTALAFIEDLRCRGAVLEAAGGRLRVTPATVLTDTDRATWQAHKPEILAALQSATGTHQGAAVALVDATSESEITALREIFADTLAHIEDGAAEPETAEAFRAALADCEAFIKRSHAERVTAKEIDRHGAIIGALHVMAKELRRTSDAHKATSGTVPLSESKVGEE